MRSTSAFAVTVLAAMMMCVSCNRSSSVRSSTVRLPRTEEQQSAHGGTWVAKATLGADPTWTKLNRWDTEVSPHTTYAASIWVRGTGTVELDIVNSEWTDNVARLVIDATDTWQLCAIPSFDSGDNAKLHFSVYDALGGAAGTMLFDDAFFGPPGGDNLLSNPGFEEGSDTWVPEGVFTVTELSSGSVACSDGAAPGKSGCPDLLDAMGSELTDMKRRAADPSTPASDRPTAAQIKELSMSANLEVGRVIDSLPNDSELGPDSDVRPYVAALGRAFSTSLQASTAPIGTLPDGGKATDLLDGTSADRTKPLFSDLFSHLAYQDDEGEMTLALYRLADFQNLVQSLNRSELVLLDEGMTEAAVALVKTAMAKKKSVVALAFYDDLLPAAMLVYDAAKRRYTPRVYQLFRLDRTPLQQETTLHVAATFKKDLHFADSPLLPEQPMDNTLLDYLYCKQPASLHTLSRFGIWLSDRTQGGRLSRARLGSVSICDFLNRVTDLRRLGAGDCSLTELVYSGYQCRSKRSCNLAPDSNYRVGVRPGASVSALNQFGIPKSLSASINCDPSNALPGGEDGYLTSRPGSECLVSPDDVAALQHAYLTCIASSNGSGIQVVEPPPDPWKSKCALIDCEEGASCPDEPPVDLGEDDTGPEAPEPSNCADDDETCKVKELATRHEDALDKALEDWQNTSCPNCLKPDFLNGVHDVIQNHLPNVDEKTNVSLSGIAVGSTNHDDPNNIVISRDDAVLESSAFEYVASTFGLTVADCEARDYCLEAAILEATSVLQITDQHEFVHAILDALLDSGEVFTPQGEAYISRYGTEFEGQFYGTQASCNRGLGATCSAQHEIEYRFFRILHPNGKGFYECGVEGACGRDCGPDDPAYDLSEACKQLVKSLQAQYDARTTPKCPAPAPNQAPSDPECRFEGCFGGPAPTTARACPFVLCTGDQAVGNDLACNCCSQCNAGAPGGPVGTSPACNPATSCNQCCIKCDVPAPDQPCPGPIGPLASEQPAGWSTYSAPPADTDGDGLNDDVDDCPNDYNPTQHDLDGDGIGYACDPNDEVTGTGVLTAWPDVFNTLQFDDLAGAHGSGIPVWWTPRDHTSGYVYARVQGLSVAATGITEFAAIHDANAFEFNDDYVQMPVGTVVILRNTTVGTYAAVRLESIYNEGSTYYCSATWLFAGHSPDFSVVH